VSNQTIFSDTNHDDLTGRGPAQDIIIYSGAVLTFDSMPQYTAMGLMGTITNYDGKTLIDARQVKEIVYSSGSGTLPVVGDIIDNDSQAGTAKVIKLNSGNATSGVMTVTRLTGDFSDSDDVSFNTSSWTAIIDTVKVGYLQFLGNLETWSATGLSTYEFRGEWYEVGVGDGTENQAFNLPHLGTQNGAWVETGNGTGVFKKFNRTGATAITDFGTGDDFGRVFNHVPCSGVMTFGTFINGGVVPTGARVRIPNLHLGTALSGSPTVELNPTTAAFTTFSIMGTLSSAAFIVDKVNFSTFRTDFNGFDTAAITSSILPTYMTRVYFLSIVSSVVVTDCIFGAFADFNSKEDNMIFCQDSANITVDDCRFYSDTYSLNSSTCQLETSSGINITDCEFVVGDKEHNWGGQRPLYLLYCVDTNISNSTVIRGNITIAGGSDILISNTRYADNTLTGTLSTASPVNLLVFLLIPSNVLIDGIELIGDPPYSHLINVIDASDCIIRNFGSITSKIDLLGHTDTLFTIAGLVTNFKMQRIWTVNQRGEPMGLMTPTCLGVVFENCSAKYNAQHAFDCKNPTVRGIHSASGDFNATDGMDVDYPLTVGYHFTDVFTSDTTGRLHFLFTPPTAETAQYVTLSSGGIWRKDGDLLLKTVGDYVEIESPYTIKGHTGFVNTDYVASGLNTNKVDVEYSLDTGSGYGAYKAATGANLSGEALSPTGFKIKVKVTCNTTDTTNYINGLFFETTTTLTNQSNNFYPLDEAAITINAQNLIDGTRVRLYNVTKAQEIDNSVVLGGSGYSIPLLVNNGVNDAGDAIRLTATHQSGTTAKIPLVLNAVLTSANYSFIDAQVELSDYPSLGVDGSTVTEYTLDVANVQIDANDVEGVSKKKRLVASYYHLITTANGIRYFLNAIILEDNANARIDRNVTALMLDNISNSQLVFDDDDFRLYTSDGSPWVLSPSTGGYGVTSTSGRVYNTEASDVALIKAKIDENLDATVSSRSTFNHASDEVIINGPQIDAALVSYDGPTKAELDAAFDEIKGDGFTTQTLKDIRENVGAVDLEPLTTILEDMKGAGFNAATDSLEAIRDRGDNSKAEILEALIAIALSLADIPTNTLKDDDVRLDHFATLSDLLNTFNWEYTP